MSELPTEVEEIAIMHVNRLTLTCSVKRYGSCVGWNESLKALKTLEPGVRLHPSQTSLQSIVRDTELTIIRVEKVCL